MDELSLNILDIAYNSIRADASLIQIKVVDSILHNHITMTIIDDGKGMSEDEVKKVENPFYTTRTTRKVGLGIPLLKQNAELCGGYLKINSLINKGTSVEVKFIKNHIDTPMMGDLIETILTLIQADEHINYVFEYITDSIEYRMDTCEMKSILGNVPIHSFDVMVWLKEHMKEGMNI